MTGFWDWLKSPAFVYVRIKETQDKKEQIKTMKNAKVTEVIDVEEYELLDKEETKLLR